MGQLRDFFAAVGFCESTADLERKPALLDKIVKNSLYYADPQTALSKGASYESRLRLALGQASTANLERLIHEQVTVCLDQRLANLESGFWDSEIYAVYYDDGERKVLGLYDNGKSYEDTGFFETGVIDHSEDAIDDLIEEVFDEGRAPSFLLGTTHTVSTGKSTYTYFEWHDEGDFESELRKNPALRTPPLKKGPVNAPVGYTL